MDYYNILIWAVLAIGGAIAAFKFYKLGKQQQLDKVKQWLLLAVIEAEQLLGSKTGEIKLKLVYSRFTEKFKVMSRIITYEQFKVLIDDALKEMKELIGESQD
jgi:hypothetical protein